MRCHDVKKYMSDYIDNQVSQDLSGKLKSHILKCEDCRQYETSLRQAVNFVKQTPVQDVPDSVWMGIQEQISRKTNWVEVVRGFLGELLDIINIHKRGLVPVGVIATLLFMVISLSVYMQSSDVTIENYLVNNAEFSLDMTNGDEESVTYINIDTPEFGSAVEEYLL